ncbi:hypothetical protein [Terrimonas pollutisoli]|uniref:hypothetical protein n=1 Tax=Terrimonas pollutisoli TaxID=3034147 RepID=UPI0023ED71E4|nr:hypothetical protein [Terrimonas sp. H1YJ31]
MKHLLFVLCCLVISNKLRAQGCSDAGFCSLGILKTNAPSASKKYSLAIGANYGAGEQSTNTFNPYLEYAVRFNNRISGQVKMTAVYASGFLGSTFNVGDIFGFVNYAVKTKNSNRLSLLSGVKIPLSHANDKNDEGKPLPLDYQSSVGTFDIVEGINYIIKEKWELNAGIQIPVIHKNKNTFFPDEYTDPRISHFAATNNFKRKSDALLRLGHYFYFKQSSITLKPNILAIYHLGEDSYENRLGMRQKIKGSDGLTMNAGIIATKRFHNENDLELIVAAPFVVRDTRSDGLTRSVVVNIQYRFRF